jgi:hypothetical protein
MSDPVPAQAPCRGTVRLSGGPLPQHIKVSVFDGREWVPLRAVASLSYDVGVDRMPRLQLWLSEAALDISVPPGGVGYEVLRDSAGCHGVA